MPLTARIYRCIYLNESLQQTALRALGPRVLDKTKSSSPPLFYRPGTSYVFPNPVPGLNLQQLDDEVMTKLVLDASDWLWLSITKTAIALLDGKPDTHVPIGIECAGCVDDSNMGEGSQVRRLRLLCLTARVYADAEYEVAMKLWNVWHCERLDGFENWMDIWWKHCRRRNTEGESQAHLGEASMMSLKYAEIFARLETDVKDLAICRVIYS
ncbi:hypothetical protein EDC01DRAFT_626053 [Geopyxis carbonaria]|nr:hypothetical protein EDC01DRAFT_626053 [Geopyxis carbonaria]